MNTDARDNRMDNTIALENIMPKLRQTTQQYTVQLTLPSVIDFDLLKVWLKEVFEIEEIHSADNTIEQISQKALLLTKTLLYHSNIPVFYDGYVEDCVEIEGEKNKYRIDLAIGHVSLIANEHYTAIVNFAFKYIFWMMQNQLTPGNKQSLYKACLDEIINPIRTAMPFGQSTKYMLKIAYSKNIPFIHLGAGVYQLGWGAKARRIDRTTMDTDSAMGVKLSQNKILTANLLRMAGFPAPKHGFTNLKDVAVKIANDLTYPVVVKPTDLDRGEGVSINITSDTQLLTAFEEAMKLSKSKQVIVEKQVEGVCHRLFIAGGKLLYGVARLPLSVKADGVKTVAELIIEANEKEMNKAPWLRYKSFPSDALAVEAISKSGFSLSSVPPMDTWIPLRDIESTQWGGRGEDVTQIIHPDNIDIAQRTSALFGLQVVGVDIITADISKPWHEIGAIINEVNFAPLYAEGETSKIYMPAYFDSFINKDGRIPLEIYIGSDEKTMQTAKERQKKLVKDGLRCYVTTHETTLDDSDGIIQFPSQSLSNRVQALLINSDVEALVIIIQNDELLRGYIPFDKVSELTIVSKNIITLNDNSKTASDKDFDKLVGSFTIDKF